MSKKEGKESTKAEQLEELKDLDDMRTKLHINWHHVAAHANVLCAAGANVGAHTCKRAINAGAMPVNPAAVAKLVQWLAAAQHAVAAGKVLEEAFVAVARQEEAAARQAQQAKSSGRMQAGQSARTESKTGEKVRKEPCKEEGALFRRPIDGLLCQRSSGVNHVLCTMCWEADGTVRRANYKGITNGVKSLCAQHGGSEAATQRGVEEGRATDTVIEALQGEARADAVAAKARVGRTTDAGMNMLEGEARADAVAAKARAGLTTQMGMRMVPVADRTAAEEARLRRVPSSIPHHSAAHFAEWMAARDSPSNVGAVGAVGSGGAVGTGLPTYLQAVERRLWADPPKRWAGTWLLARAQAHQGSAALALLERAAAVHRGVFPEAAAALRALRGEAQPGAGEAAAAG